jgi:hypothetical protein
MFNEIDASEQEDVEKTPKKKHKIAAKGKGKKTKKKGGKKKHSHRKKVTAKAA